MSRIIIRCGVFSVVRISMRRISHQGKDGDGDE
nr:MAG TPA: hypothetical protein [Caudoviricetes sp.]